VWLRRLDCRHRLYLAPFQWEWLRIEAGLSVLACEQAAWAVMPDGSRYHGAAAINVALDQILGGSAICYQLYQVPLIRQLQDSLYQWVVEHRHRFPGVTPAIQQ
jgi:predicted DCC family thiol-disulfide oxidoreductase YuxK